MGRILEEEKYPKRRNVVLIVSMFFIVLLINILKGGGGFQSPLGIECGSTYFWVAQGLLLVWILSISWLGRSLLLKDSAKKAEAGYVYLDEDLKWDKKSTVIYPLISTLAGFCAGMFGIGGGIIKGPLMLAMGVHPAVASATSACMILFTSFTATTTFSVYGLMVTDYAIVGAILGFCATFRTNCHVPDTCQVQAQLIHCLLHWVCCFIISPAYDIGVGASFGLGRTK